MARRGIHDLFFSALSGLMDCLWPPFPRALPWAGLFRPLRGEMQDKIVRRNTLRAAESISVTLSPFAPRKLRYFRGAKGDSY